MYRPPRKLILRVLVSILFLFSFAIGSVAEAQFVDSGRLVYGMYADVQTLDPGEANIWYDSMIVRNVHEGLLQYNIKNYTIEPLLAISWDRHDDGGTFRLRRGVKFHDGTEFNAEAVRFNWQRHMALKKAHSTWLKDIKDIQVIDNYTVRIVTEKNWAFLLDVLASHCVFLFTSPTYVKQHATQDDPWAAKWLHSNTCGTGPYMATKWEPDQYITMVRNKDYWKGWSGKHFSEVVYRIVPEVNARRMLIKRGEIDILNDMAVEYWDELKADPKLILKVIPSKTQEYFTMNNYRGPCTDKNLRLAITYAVDYDACREVVGALNQPLMIGPAVKRDVKKAMEYKNKSAYAGKELEISLSTISGLSQHKKLALVLQNNLKDIGIKVNWQEQTYPTWAKGVYGGYKEASDMYPYYAVPVIDDDYGILFRVLHSKALSPGGSNLGYSNPKFDALIDQARNTIDKNKRRALYDEAKKVAVDDVAYVWLLMYPWIAIYQKDIKVYLDTEVLDSLGCTIRFYDLYRE